MKKLFLSAIMLFSVMSASAQTIIDYDYTKSINMNTVWIDYNQNDEMEEDEFYPLTDSFICNFTIKYKDFGSAGSKLYMTMYIYDKKKDERSIAKANLNDAVILKSGNNYFIINKLKEKLVGIAFDEDNKANLFIYNPLIFD